MSIPAILNLFAGGVAEIYFEYVVFCEPVIASPYGVNSVSEYTGLLEQEAFDIEYWALEEAKLKRMPKPKSLAGRDQCKAWGDTGRTPQEI